MKQSEKIPLFAIMILQGFAAKNYAQSESAEYDYDEYNEVSVGKVGDYEYPEEAVTSIPEFLSHATNLDVDEGETFSLPCFVTRMDDYVLMWMKNEKIISLGRQILNNEGARYNLELSKNGNKLVVKDATPSDRGTYYCQVSSYNLANIQHTVSVRVQPVIETVPSGKVSLKEGDSVKLSCYLVAGEPYPEVYWMIRNDENDTEHLEQELDLINVSRHHTGQYICLADNGFGLKPVSSEVAIIVEYAPEIDIEQVYLQSTTGSHIYISCIVQSSPQARVTWAKDGQNIDSDSDHYSVTVDGNSHNLILLTITAESFGVYSCSAENSLGVSKMTTHVSDMGCWATHQTEYLSEEDLKLLTEAGYIESDDLLYGIVCKHPFVDLLDEQSQNHVELEEETSPQIDTSHISEITSASSTANNENRVRLDPEEKERSSYIPSNENFDNNDKVELHVYVMASDVDEKESSESAELPFNNPPIGRYPASDKPNENKKGNSQIISTESRTETVEILMPSDSIEPHVSDKSVIEAKENKKDNKHVIQTALIESVDYEEVEGGKLGTTLNKSQFENNYEIAESMIHDVNDATITSHNYRNIVKEENLVTNSNASNLVTDYEETKPNSRDTNDATNFLNEDGNSFPEETIITHLNKGELETDNEEAEPNANDATVSFNFKESVDYGKDEDNNLNTSKVNTSYAKVDPSIHDDNDAISSSYEHQSIVNEGKLATTLNKIEIEKDYEEDEPNIHDATISVYKVGNSIAEKKQVTTLNKSELETDYKEGLPKLYDATDANISLNEPQNIVNEEKPVTTFTKSEVKTGYDESESNINDAIIALHEVKHGDESAHIIANSAKQMEREETGNPEDNSKLMHNFQKDDYQSSSNDEYPQESAIRQSEPASITKPNISYIIETKDSKPEQPVRSVLQLVQNYKSVKFEECKLWSNIVIENENTIKMTIRETARDCHLDCQVTAGCLGWFFGDVGGLDSCVLYGCGKFKKMVQINTVSCRIGDCLDDWMDELYSCKFKNYYSYVGEERFERIIQAKGNANQLSCGSLTVLLVLITVYVSRL